MCSNDLNKDVKCNYLIFRVLYEMRAPFWRHAFCVICWYLIFYVLHLEYALTEDVFDDVFDSHSVGVYDRMSCALICGGP